MFSLNYIQLSNKQRLPTSAKKKLKEAMDNPQILGLVLGFLRAKEIVRCCGVSRLWRKCKVPIKKLMVDDFDDMQFGMLLKKVINVEYLYLGSELSDQSMIHIYRNARNVKGVSISFNHNITNRGIYFLGGLENLEYLDVGTLTKIDGDCLQHLSDCKMKHLVTPSGMTEKNGEYLLNFGNLERLRFGIFGQDDVEVLQYVGLLKSLKNLDISLSYKVSNDSLRRLANLDNLEILNISGCVRVNDKGLSYLSNLKNLQYIIIRNMEQLTDKGLKKANLSYCR